MLCDEKSFLIYENHVYDFEHNFTQRKIQPRSKDWRSPRVATRNFPIAFLTLRHQIKENIIEVDVFITMDPDGIEGFSGTKATALCILCEAYKCGSTMGIRFTNKVEDGTIPINIIAIADSLKIDLKYILEGFVTPKESRMLFLALTGFSAEATKRIKELSISNLITPERICYLVHHGIWTLEEMESILLGCDHPEMILDEKIDILDSLLYLDVFSRARTAVMGGLLDQKLKLKEVYEGNVFVDVEANDRNFEVSFDPRYFAKVYDTLEDTPIPWIKDQDWIVPAGQRLVVAVRPYDWTDLHNNLQRDLEMCSEMIKCYPENEFPIHFFMLTPRDVFSFPESLDFETYRLAFEKTGFTFMVCPELLTESDDKVLKRIQQMSLVRHDIAIGEAAKRENFVNKLPSDFNKRQLRFISVPTKIEEGVTRLPQLVDQALYDEKELTTGVNRKNVENRHYRVLDRISYLGKVALLSPETIWKDFDGEILDQISLLLSYKRDQLRSSRLVKTIYPFSLLKEIIKELKGFQTFLPKIEEIISFLEMAKKNRQSVIVINDQHNNEGKKNIYEKGINDEQLETTFNGQFVLDKVIDYSNMSLPEVAKQIIWNSVNSSKAGRINMTNLGELPHVIITESLYYFSYRELKDNDFPISINITYTDGSQAKPFPLFRLKKRSNEELEELRKITPLKIGMLSCRHPELDSIIDNYWLRNIEMRMAGSTSAEKDDFAYQTTKEKLAQIIERNHPVRINFYQTGFQPIVIGFYRAVVEFLMETQNGSPYLEIIPLLYNSHTNEHDPAKYSWC